MTTKTIYISSVSGGRTAPYVVGPRFDVPARRPNAAAGGQIWRHELAVSEARDWAAANPGFQVVDVDGEIIAAR